MNASFGADDFNSVANAAMWKLGVFTTNAQPKRGFNYINLKAKSTTHTRIIVKFGKYIGQRYWATPSILIYFRWHTQLCAI